MWINNRFKSNDVVRHILEPERKGIVDAMIIERSSPGTIRYRILWGPGYSSVENEEDLEIQSTFNEDTLDHIDDYPYGDPP